MKTRRILALLLATALPAHAQDGSGSPFVACVEATGEIFRGFSMGVDAGPLAATSKTGTTCKGEWQRLDTGAGAATFTCNDGRWGTALYDWFDPDTGTAVGTGEMDNQNVVRFWSGYRLEDYFNQIDPAERARMTCLPSDLLLS